MHLVLHKLKTTGRLYYTESHFKTKKLPLRDFHPPLFFFLYEVQDNDVLNRKVAAGMSSHSPVVMLMLVKLFTGLRCVAC